MARLHRKAGPVTTLRFAIEWTLAMHRAMFFPLYWTLGLDRPAVDWPAELGPAIAGTTPVPLFREGMERERSRRRQRQATR